MAQCQAHKFPCDAWFAVYRIGRSPQWIKSNCQNDYDGDYYWTLKVFPTAEAREEFLRSEKEDIMKRAKTPAEKIVYVWKCPTCGMRAAFLPPSLETLCPKCKQTKAMDFIVKAIGGWLNEGCPGWADEEAMPEDHIPGDKACRCPACVENRACEAEWRMEGER